MVSICGGICGGGIDWCDRSVQSAALKLALTPAPPPFILALTAAPPPLALALPLPVGATNVQLLRVLIQLCYGTALRRAATVLVRARALAIARANAGNNCL